MITPRFEISQSDKDITITIYAPYTNIKDAEVFIEDNEFRFFSSPYYLRLHLPGNIEENEQSSGNYESDSGRFIFIIEKQNKGEYFNDLDYITLLNPKEIKVNLNKSRIEEIDNNDEDDNEEKEEEFDWFYEQKLPEPESDPLNLLNKVKYGFANQHSGVFKDFKHLYNEIIDISAPDEIIENKRNDLRIERENSDFSEDHYLYDFMESTEIKVILDLKSVWIDKLNGDFTLEEIELLKELSNKRFILERDELQTIYFSLVDILFAWCYDKRTTEGESTCVSPWTINKLSSTFSWLQNFTSINEVKKACIRRSLCYPLHRNYELACLILNDVYKIFEIGKKSIIKCLIEIYHMFNNSEPRYIFNELFLKDMLVWVQRSSKSHLISLNQVLLQNTPSKKDIELNLELIELLAYKMLDEHNKKLVTPFSELNINENTSSSSNDSSSESSTDLDSDSEELDSDDEELDSGDEELDSDDEEIDSDDKKEMPIQP